MEKKYIILFNNKTVTTYSCAEIISDPMLIAGFWKERVVFSFEMDEETNKLVVTIPKDAVISARLNRMELPVGKVRLRHNDLLAVQHNGDICYILYVDGTERFKTAFVQLKENAEIIIGRAKNGHVIIDHPAAQEKHVRLAFAKGTLQMYAASGSYTYVNGKFKKQGVVQQGDCIQILSCTIYNLGSSLCLIGEFQTNGISECTPDEQKETGVNAEFTPVPRVYRSVEQEIFTIDPPPAKSEPRAVPFILSVGPSLTMSLGMLVSVAVSIGNVVNNGMSGTFITSSFMALSMLLGALLWPTLLRRYNRKQQENFDKHRVEAYTAYLKEKEAEISQVYQKNEEIVSKYQLPSVERLCSAFDEKQIAPFLWERDLADNDFLTIRLGCGQRSSDLNFHVAEKHFSLREDDLEEETRRIADRYSTYDNAPVAISLRENPLVGLFGRASSVEAIVDDMIAEIVFLHSAEKVKTAFIFGNREEALRYWHYCDIPHMWNVEKDRRYLASSEKDAEAILSEIYNKVLAPEGVALQASKEHYVVLAWDREKVEKTALYRQIKDAPLGSRVSFVFIASEYGKLPQECMAVVQCTKELNGVYIKNQNDNRLIPFQPDDHNRERLQGSIKKIKSLVVQGKKNESSLPQQVVFLDLFRAANLEELNISGRWKSGVPQDTLKTPIGFTTGNAVVEFDIHEKAHGCHGIVAGTTGSGKSEFLQSYILSMMVNYSPDVVNFVLIDFKGGDIATPFLGLPHLSAVVSNLSKSILSRAMVSLEAEQIRRQKLFNEKKRELNIDKIDINSYQRLYRSGAIKEPLPHLIIIMDEFAQFKMQHSEYMQKLIDIAQIGRSLGIHLILATQKPAGIVDGQIWGNSKFKFCLKVLEREDSKSVLQRDEAAFIKNPGRGYMQVGYNEIFTQFQAGYCRAKYVAQEIYRNADDLTVQMVDSTGNVTFTKMDIATDRSANTKTQISAIVEELHRVSEAGGYSARPMWLPALGEQIYAEDCPVMRSADGYDLPLGVVDIPTEQKQCWCLHNFVQDGNIAVYGASGSGKTTMIQTLLYQATCRFTPEQFRYGIIDLGGRSYSLFEKTAHSIGCAMGDDMFALEALLRGIGKELAYRKEVLAEYGCNSFRELHQTAPEKLPVLMIVLENYAKFREAAYAYEEQIIDAVSSGAACGIYFVVSTNSKSGIYYKVREHLSRVIAFNMSDADAYRDILGVRIDITPGDAKGRALMFRNEQIVELQAALPVKEASESDRVKVMKQQLLQYQRTEGKTPPEGLVARKTVTPLAQKAEQVQVENDTQYISVPEGPQAMMIGLDNRTHERQYVDLAVHKRIFVCSQSMEHVSGLCEQMLSEQMKKNIWFVTGQEATPELLFAEIEDCAARNEVPTMIIPDFVQMYQDITNENLEKLHQFVRKHPELVCISCAKLDLLSDFVDTALYLDLCKKATVIVFTGGTLDEKTAARMNGYVAQTPAVAKAQVLEAGNAFVVVEGQCAATYFQEDA